MNFETPARQGDVGQASVVPVLPPQQISSDVLREKYMEAGETGIDDVFRRVARGLAAVENSDAMRSFWEERFYENMQDGAIGAGRIMSAAGTDMDATLINCFVQPIGDAILDVDEEGLPGIFIALRDAAETMRRGGGVGYNFSRLRPRGALVKATNSQSSGPCSYMDVFDKACSTVESAGFRRGAQMGILNIDHPDIEEFIVAKRTKGRWNNFNVSVAVTDQFMRAVMADTSWDLHHTARPFDTKGKTPISGGWIYKTVRARDLWNQIMQSAYDFAEPGIFFIDNVNRDNNLRYCEKIDCCNPCGEQPLPAYGCCDLGPIILTKFVRDPFTADAQFDFDAFNRAVGIQVRMLDNVLDATYWPLDQQRAESAAKRRIGVGFTGLGNALAMLGLHYGSGDARHFASSITRSMRDAAYEASVELAQEKGPFPLFDAKGYLAEGTFASRLPAQLKDQIREHGIRNSHLLSIAPTGTVSLAFADNASNGIEPPFLWSYDRKKREGDGTTSVYQVQDHAYRLYKAMFGEDTKLPPYFVTALELSAADHLSMMAAVQPYIDTAISKTVNVPAEYPFDDFKEMYLSAWQSGLKGLATYRPNDILGSVLSATPAPVAAPAVAEVDEMRKPLEKRPVGGLPAVAEKLEYWTHEGRQTLYLMVTFLPLADGRERAIEFFMPVGQNGESQQWTASSMRLLCLAARGGFLEKALTDMRKVAWDRGPVRLGSFTKADGTNVPMWHDSEVAAIAYAIQNIITRRAEGSSSVLATPPAQVTMPQTMAGKKCGECGAHAVIKKDGCDYCTACGQVGSCG